MDNSRLFTIIFALVACAKSAHAAPYNSFSGNGLRLDDDGPAVRIDDASASTPPDMYIPNRLDIADICMDLSKSLERCMNISYIIPFCGISYNIDGDNKPDQLY